MLEPKESSSALVDLAPDTLLSRIELQREAIAAFVTENTRRLHPECDAVSARDRLGCVCQADVAQHLDHVLSALAMKDARIFLEYLGWLRSVLCSRRYCLEYSRDSIGLLRDYLLRIIEYPHRPAVADLMNQGIRFFNQGQPSESDLLASTGAHTDTARGFAQLLLDGRRREAKGQLEEALRDGLSYVETSVDIVQPAMYEVGRLWQSNRITITQEHLATAIAHNALAQMFNEAEFLAPNGRRAAFACVAGNFHTLGLRMVCDAFDIAGWDVDYLGSGAPEGDLLTLLDQRRPDMLGLSVSMPYHVLTLRQLIPMIKAELGSACPAITAGGLPLRHSREMRENLNLDAWYEDAKQAVEDSR